MSHVPVGGEDFPVDEAAVMRGDYHRIAPAVENASLMGFDATAATAAAKAMIIAYPGRDDVSELVIDQLLAGCGGGERLFKLPKEAPRAYLDGAVSAPPRRTPAPEEDAVAGGGGGGGAGLVEDAIDLTGASPPEDGATGGWKRHKTTAEKADVITIDGDDVGAGVDLGGGAGGASGVGGNSLMAQLARERMLRASERGDAPPPISAFHATPRSTANDHLRRAPPKAPENKHNLTGAAARVASLAEESVAGGTSTGKQSKSGGGELGILDALLSGVAPLRDPLKEIRLLTYNVWFAEHVALVDRMQGLSDVVSALDPHVLCLQEVTPNILMLLHAQPWFEEYKGTPPPPQQYFTLVLFKRSLDNVDKSTKIVRREFITSKMGRYADGVAGMYVGGDKEITVFSSHLESFISKQQTSSDERVRQMKDALRALDGLTTRRGEERRNRACANAVFMGDTNWDEATDGPVPLPEGWADAWETHGDGGPGFTYDLKKNAMMSGYLQKRLDRVLYKLADFRVAKIEMVGTTPVTRKDGSVVTHVNEFRGRRETKPVLPSDHFGLFVALEPIEDA